MNKEAHFRDLLRTNGESITSPRLIAFRTLARRSPISSVKLVELLKDDGINESTTYRNLTLFRRLGLITDIVAGGKRLIELSEHFGEHHHHFWCTSCGELQDFDYPGIDEAITRLAEVSKLKVTTHQVELSGLCTNCLAKEPR